MCYNIAKEYKMQSKKLALIGEKIKKLRTYKGLTKQSLGKKLNVSTATISMWENGQRKPDLNKLINLSNLFNVSIDWLINDDEQTIDIKLPNTENSVILIGRNGTMEKYTISDAQVKALQMFAEALTQKDSKKK